MNEISMIDYDRLPIIVNDDTLLNLNSLDIGDKYLIFKDDGVDLNDHVSVYKVINKKEDSIESIPITFKIK